MKSEKSGARGSKIRSETGPTREKTFSGMSKNEALKGKKMGGGSGDVSHSLTGAGQVKKV